MVVGSSIINGVSGVVVVVSLVSKLVAGVLWVLKLVLHNNSGSGRIHVSLPETTFNA